jgi:catechol 2,3-dioxygenase-like lactoylglutathione lyase family enzyme
MSVHLHHIHMNVAGRDATAEFYETFFSAKRVRLNNAIEALYAAPALLLLEERAQAPVSTLPTALQHVGWGSADVSAWYEMARAGGVLPDTRGLTLFGTPEAPMPGEPGQGPQWLAAAPACFPKPDAISYIYMRGPDDERIEVWSGADKRLNHVHFTTSNLMKTARWYQTFLGLAAVPDSTLSYHVFIDDISFFFESQGTAEDYAATDDHVLGHIAFSVSDLDVWLERATEQSIEIVSQPAEVAGFKSFFVRGPDGMLIELVAAAPLPDLCSAETSAAGT